MTFTKGITFAGIGAGGFYFAGLAGKYSIPLRIGSALVAAYGGYLMYQSLFGSEPAEPVEIEQVGAPNAAPGSLSSLEGEILSPAAGQDLGSGGLGSSTIPVTVKLVNPTLSKLSGTFLIQSQEVEIGFLDYGYSSPHEFSLGPLQAKTYTVEHPATNAFLFGVTGKLSLTVGEKLLDQTTYKT